MDISYYFQGVIGKTPQSRSTRDIYNEIVSGDHKVMIEQARKLLTSNQAAYSDFKKRLPAFTVSGQFKDRKKESLISYSGLLQGDFDSLENPEQVRDMLAQDKHIEAVFISPSAKGVKAFIKVNPDPEKHLENFQIAEQYFKEKYDLDLDKSCKDIARLFFVSYDPDAKYNENAVSLNSDDLTSQPKAESKQILFEFDATKVKPFLPHEGKSDTQRIEEALNYIPPTDEYQRYIEIGMAIKDCLGDAGFALWDSWCKKSYKYNAGQQAQKWDSFNSTGLTGGTIFYFASEYGYMDSEEQINLHEEVREVAKIPDVKKIERDVAEFVPQGIIGDIVDYQTRQAVFPQPVLALASILATLSTLLGQKIRTVDGIRTSVFIAGLAETAYGKETARVFIKNLFMQAQARGLAAEKVTGRSAIERSLKDCGSCGLYLIDEFGIFMQGVLAKNAPHHIKEVMTTFMEFFTSSNSRYLGQDKASKENKRYEFINPIVSIYGTATPSTFWTGMSTDNITNGSLNRFLLFFAPEQRPERQKIVYEDKLPMKFIEFVEKIGQVYDPMNLGENNELTIIHYTDDAEEQFDRFADKILERLDDRSDITSHIWGRTAEYAKKLALIRAGAEFSDVITLDHAKWACELVYLLTHNMAVEVKDCIFDNEYERTSKRLEDVIKKAGKKGITKSALWRKSRWIKNSRERAAMIQDLLLMFVIFKTEIPPSSKGGPITTRFTHAKFCSVD